MQKTIPGSGRSPGGEYGNPLQYSCLENPMDRGTWQATVHRAAKSWTQLKRLSTHAYHAFILQTTCQMFLCSLIQAYEISTRISFLQASELKHRASYFTQLYLTFCNSTDHRQPESSIHVILQARILEWVSILFSKSSS